MKKVLFYLLLFSLSLTQAQEIQLRTDSLKNKLAQSKGTQWIDIAVELASEISFKEPEYSEKLIEDAIEFSKNLDYQTGLANAYQVQALTYFDKNKYLSGVTLYGKSYKIFTTLDQHSEIAISLYGIASGLARIQRNKEAIDTLKYTLIHYYDSISPKKKSDIYQLLSKINKSEGETKLAINYIDTAIQVEKDAGLKESLASSYNSLGIIYSDISDFKNSLYYYDLFEENARDIKDTLLISYALHNKAVIYLDWGIYDEALTLFLKSQEIVEAKGLEEELIATKSAIASVYSEIGDSEKTKFYSYQALELAEKYNDIPVKAVILHNLGENLYEEQKYDSALIFLNASLRLEQQEGNTMGIAESKSMIGTVYTAQNKFNIAFKYFNEAEKVFIKFGSKQDLASLYIEYAKAHQKLDNDSLSVKYFQKGIEIAKAIGAQTVLAEGYKSASINYERLNRFEEALIYFKKSEEISKNIFSEHSTTRLEYMTARLESQEHEKELVQLENDKKVLTLETKNRTLLLIAAGIIFILTIAFFNWRFYMKRKAEIRLNKQYDILLESEQKIKALLDASFDSTLLVNLKGVILTINANNLDGFFTNTESMILKKLLNYFNTTNQKMLQKFFELVLNSKEPKEFQLHEENDIILNIKISPVLDISNKVGSLAFYIKNITQIEKDKKHRVKMEKQIIQTQKMETIGTLAGGIAHDFNNSLATIQGYVSMALEDIDSDSYLHRYLVNTQKAVTISRDTVKKLLAFSRTDDVVFDKIKLDDLINDSVDMVKGSKPKNINFKYPSSKSLFILLADKSQLTQVILNICNNAFHSIGDKKGEVEIGISETRKHPEFINKNMVIIKISDNGMGMSEDVKKRIFEPFFTTKKVGKGTGLGLSVVSGIIKKHNGKIEVSSEIGKGSTFSLFLPLIKNY